MVVAEQVDREVHQVMGEVGRCTRWGRRRPTRQPLVIDPLNQEILARDPILHLSLLLFLQFPPELELEPESARSNAINPPFHHLASIWTV